MTMSKVLFKLALILLKMKMSLQQKSGASLLNSLQVKSTEQVMHLHCCIAQFNSSGVVIQRILTSLISHGISIRVCQRRHTEASCASLCAPRCYRRGPIGPPHYGDGAGGHGGGGGGGRGGALRRNGLRKDHTGQPTAHHDCWNCPSCLCS